MGTFHKQGRIFDPSVHTASWYVSHAAIPVAHPLGDMRCRAYFSARDAKNRAQIGSFDFDLNQPERILSISEQPVIALGPLGAYDDNGVTSACIVEHHDTQYMYFTGWNIGVTVPFYFYVGCAVSTDRGATFTRVSAAPVLERSAVDPYLTASPSILIENGIWRMWYISCTGWTIVDGSTRHYYHIKYAESRDGIVWDRRGIVCVDYKDLTEYALARPVVRKRQDGHGDLYEMWFSHRGDSYRIGYASSRDGIEWTRDDSQSGIDVSYDSSGDGSGDSSAEGWDSEMVAYGDVFTVNGIRYMLYNGNAYGKTGIGLAVESEQNLHAST